jgi:hypothetical protein
MQKKAFISIFTIFFSAIVISVLSSLYVLLVKQIEIMNLDSSSYQSLFVADSAFECAMFKEQKTFANPDDNKSIFIDHQPSETCYDVTDDLNQVSQDTVTQSPSVRSKGVFNMKMNVNGSDYCAVLTTDKETGITAYFTSAPDPDTISISARSTSCSEPDTTKAIERLIEFYY